MKKKNNWVTENKYKTNDKCMLTKSIRCEDSCKKEWKNIKTRIKIRTCVYECARKYKKSKAREKHENEHAPMGDILPMYAYIWKPELKRFKKKVNDNIIAYL